MKKLYDLVVKTGEYTKGTETKSQYKNVGVVLEGDKGPYILLDKTFNPAGISSEKSTIIISMFAPKEQNKNNDELPF